MSLPLMLAAGPAEGSLRDVLGYYALLGLDSGQHQDVSESTIKRAFREAALQWHPDQQEVRIPRTGTSCLLAVCWPLAGTRC